MVVPADAVRDLLAQSQRLILTSHAAKAGAALARAQAQRTRANTRALLTRLRIRLHGGGHQLRKSR